MGNKVVASQKLCNAIAFHFEDKIAKIVGDLSPNNISDLGSLPKRPEEEPCTNTSLTNFPPFTEDSFFNMALSISSGSPLDPVPHRISKKFGQIMYPWLRQIYNQSLGEGVVPEIWKQAIVTPLLKKPLLDPTLPASFRPISLFP